MTNCPPFSADVLALDAERECERIAAWLRDQLVTTLRRRGAVVAVSGGVDSAVCLGLACRAVGPARVLALHLPGPGSSTTSAERARLACERFGVELQCHDLGPALAGLGNQERIDRAIGVVFPGLPAGTRHKIVLAGDLLQQDRGNLFDLVVAMPDGGQQRRRLPLDAYLQLTAATNMQQRLRKLHEYTAAESRNFAVLGTANRLEHELGFFVRGGDGLADVQLLAHLYKTQVWALARQLGVPPVIVDATPSTETYSLPQTQEEFFFALPLRQLDLVLWAHDHGVADERIATVLGLDATQVQRVRADIEHKRRTALRLHRPPLRLEATS